MTIDSFCLAVFLILDGLALVGFTFPYQLIIAGVCAIVAGVIMLARGLRSL